MIISDPKLPFPSVFSYHTTLSSQIDTDKTSTSLSPSKSLAYIELDPFSKETIVFSGPKFPFPSMFSYQQIMLSATCIDIISK